MTYEKITENVENISILPDDPALTPEQLKKEFDKGNKVIKEKFNKLVDNLEEDKNNIKSENYMTIRGNGDKIYNIAKEWGSTTIELDIIRDKYGDLLTASNHGIKIGKGVSLVEVSALFATWQCDAATYTTGIQKNGNLIFLASVVKNSRLDTFSTAIPKVPVPVVEGDILTLCIGSGYIGNYTVMQRLNEVFLSVKVIR